MVRIECIDNGNGIDEERKSIIFHEGNRHKKGKKGLGFGLSVLKKIVDHFNGTIWVEDKVTGDYTKGSKFIVQFPEFLS